jgi:effector protein SdbA
MVTLSGEPLAYLLQENELIASILLGSQTGKDSVAYIPTLLRNGVDRVFVFGGQSPVTYAAIEQILKDYPQYREKIIPLSYQGDSELAALMARSNFIIIRGGGLCVMEQLAMNHNKEQTVLIHQSTCAKGTLTSGISWEDDNGDSLIIDLRMRGIHALKTTPKRAIRDIAEARIIAAIKKEGLRELNCSIEDAIHLLQQLPEEQLSFYIAELKKCEYHSNSCLPLELLHYFKSGISAASG